MTGTGGEDRHQTRTPISEKCSPLWGRESKGKYMLSRGLRRLRETFLGSSFRNLSSHERKDGGVEEAELQVWNLFICSFNQF